MLKHKSKILVITIVALLFMGTFSFAEDTATTATNPETANIATDEQSNSEQPVDNSNTTESDTTDASSAQSIVSEDQYLFGDKITMDKLVDGNVYIFGNDVTISGRVAGNLFVVANKVTFTEDSVIQYVAYVSAKDLAFNGAAYDLYTISEKVTFGANSLIGRDFRTLSSSVDLKGIIIRNSIIASPNITLPDTTSAEDSSSEQNALGLSSNSIYGNLIYYSNNELQVPEGFVQGNTYFNKLPALSASSSNTVMSYITSAITFILFTMFIYGALYLRKNRKTNESKELVKNKLLPILGMGLLSLLVLGIAGIGFLVLNTTLPISLLLIAILLLVGFISLPLFTIILSNIFADKLPIPNGLIVLIASIIMWGLSLIPYFNILLHFVAIIFILGYLFFSIYGNTEKVEKKEKKDSNKKKTEEK